MTPSLQRVAMSHPVAPVVYVHLAAHVFTLVTAIALPLALWRVRHGDVAGHAGTMKGLYAGGLVIAGAFTFMPGRLLGDLVWKGCWAC